MHGYKGPDINTGKKGKLGANAGKKGKLGANEARSRGRSSPDTLAF